MEKIIKNVWHRPADAPFERSHILRAHVHPEGFDVARLRFLEAGRFAPSSSAAHLISMIAGEAELTAGRDRLQLEAGVHLYVPPGCHHAIDAKAGASFVHVASEHPVRGNELLIRDEAFLSACATESHALRWILTPQYLSRRIFLHHDRILLSKSGDPVSWFRTTMFDVAGLPPNQDGESVFKMSYNSRTEFNVIYEVEGAARVRFALHPYEASQRWDPWAAIDGDTTYHLNETPIDPSTSVRRTHRNKHEVHAASGGHVSLFCLFDPAPTGVERHRPGEYSDYEPLADVITTPEYAAHQKEIARFDRMVDRLSRAKAKGELDALRSSAEWECYQSGRSAQSALEARLAATLDARRRDVIARWMRS